MTTLQNTAAGGANGVVVTTANSGGASGDAFTTVPQTGSQTFTFDNTHVRSGQSLAYRVTTVGTSGVCYGQWALLNGAQWRARVYVYLTALPTTEQALVWLSSGTTVQASLGILTTGKMVQRASGTAGTGNSGTTTVPLNQWVRFEFAGTVGSTGTMTSAYYTGSAGESTTPAETLSTTSQNTGTANIVNVRFGNPSTSTSSTSYWIAGIAAGDDSTTFFGPQVAGANTAPSVTAGGTQTVVAGSTVTFAFGATDDTAVATFTGAVTGPAAVTLSGTASGTSASASRTYTPTATFTTPGTYVATATATDAASLTGSASTTVYVYPASGTYAAPSAVSGAWTNVGGASTALAAISDASVTTYLEAAPGTPLLVTLAPMGPGAITIGVEGYWNAGTVNRTLTLYKADGTTPIDSLAAYDITSTDNENLWAVSTTQTNSIVPNVTDRQALVLKIQDA